MVAPPADISPSCKKCAYAAHTADMVHVCISNCNPFPLTHTSTTSRCPPTCHGRTAFYWQPVLYFVFLHPQGMLEAVDQELIRKGAKGKVSSAFLQYKTCSLGTQACQQREHSCVGCYSAAGFLHASHRTLGTYCCCCCCCLHLHRAPGSDLTLLQLVLELITAPALQW